MKPMRRFLVFPAAWALLLLSGCGYHTLGSSAHLPATVHTIAVPIFKNKSQNYHTEVAMTQAVVREFTDRTDLTVLTGKAEDQADAKLSGTILNESIQPLTYKTESTSIAGAAESVTSSFLVTVRANVVLTDRDNRVLYRHDDYVFHQQYETTTDLASFIQEDSPAVQRLARDFAQTLVSDILESF